MKISKHQLPQRFLDLTPKDFKKMRKHFMNMGGPYKKMSKRMMEATIEANGGEAEMRRKLGMK